MENQLPNPVVVINPCRPYSMAARICILGVLGLTAASFFLHQSNLESAATPLFAVGGYPLSAGALCACLEITFLLVMAGLFAVLHHRAGKWSQQQAEEGSGRLKQELSRQKDREKELEVAIKDLERFNAMAMGREQRILELKHEVNLLLQEKNQPNRYNIAPEE